MCDFIFVFLLWVGCLSYRIFFAYHRDNLVDDTTESAKRVNHSFRVGLERCNLYSTTPALADLEQSILG